MVRIRTVCIPSSDSLFRDTVNGALARDTSIDAPGGLEAALHKDYPQVRVRPRELVGEVERIWYVYRNGMGFAAPGAQR
jgi:hypothetical protein